ncbi:MAG: deoxyribonuclease IV [Patescibacteria group bacterium]|jgi:deoxyribonuclease-4
MNIGAHVSIAGGLENAPLNAKAEGCECFQMFSRSPRGGKAPEINDEIVKKFQQNIKDSGLGNAYIHTPYYINLASKQDRVRNGSISIIREELDRASQLGVAAVMTHLGSSKDFTRAKALRMVIDGIKQLLIGYKGDATFLLEIAAGSGNIIGDSFEEIGEIIKKVDHKKVAVCFDTAHAFASGYDLRTKKDVDETLKKFDQAIGLDLLQLIHANDSKVELNAKVDRHEHIGKGEIGEKGFAVLINHPKLKNVDFILETPAEDRGSDIKLLKKLRKK